MRDFKDVKKKVMAVLMCGLIISSTAGSDLFVLATEENNCEEFVDEHTYMGSILSPEGSSDGNCDNCGQVEGSHTEEALAVSAESETVADESAVDYSETDSTLSDSTAPSDEQSADNAGADLENNADATDTPSDALGETTFDEETDTPSDTIDDCEHVDEDADGICDICGLTISTDEQEEIADEDDTEECEHIDEDNDGICDLCGEEIEKEDEEEEECDHQWSYVSNDDGTHVKTCELCGESEIEDCSFDDEKKCRYCGYEEGMKFEYQSFSKNFHGVIVTVSGQMPVGADVTIYNANNDRAEEIVNDNINEGTFKVYEAFDITIYDGDGNKYQPEDYGKTVNVTFSGIDELTGVDQSEVEVYRIENSRNITEMDAEVIGEDVYFEAEHFTTYVTGSRSDQKYYQLESYENFATIATASTSYSYSRAIRAKFDVYIDSDQVTDGVAFTFNATAYKNLTSSTDPTAGSEVATGDSTDLVATEEGWYTITIDLKVKDNGYVAAGKPYSIVVVSNEAVNVGYGELDSDTYILDGSGSWSEDTTHKGILYLVEGESTSDTTTIEVTNSPDGTYTIESISATSCSPSNSGEYYYSVGDTDTFIATLSDSSVERTITWTSSATDIATIDSSGKLTAVATGKTTITATLGSSTKTATVNVLEIKVAGTATGSTYSTAYTGSEIKPTITAYIGTNTVTVASSYSDNTNAGTATVTVSYTVDTAHTYQFTRNFTITPLTLTSSVFTYTVNSTTTYAKFTVSGDSITSFDGLQSVSGVTPVYSTDSSLTDFTATISDKSTSSAGIAYTIAIQGTGNFTGSFAWTPVVTGTDIKEVLSVSLSSSSRLKSIYYTGNAVSLTAVQNDSAEAGWSEVTFYDSDGNEVDDIVTASTATYVISDYSDSTGAESNINAGKKKITFTMNSSSGYTGTIDVTFTIRQAYMSNATITWTSSSEFKHTGSAIEPAAGTTAGAGDFDVYLNSVWIDPSNYTVAYSDEHKDIGSYTMTVTGTGTNFTSDTYKTSTYTIVASYALDMIVRINDGSNDYDGTVSNSYATGYSKYYDGTTAYPDITIYLPGVGALTVDTHYTLSIYDDSSCTTALTSAIGTKYIKVIGAGNYAGNTTIATYTVTARPISSSVVKITKNISAKTFTGQEITLTTATTTSESKDISIKYGSSTMLVEGTDYTISYSDNYNVGTASYVITGTGNYTGSISGTFTISAATLTTTSGDSTKAYAVLTGDTSYTYDGTEHEPSVQVTIGSQIISQSDTNNNDKANYTIEYDSNVSVGTGTVTITGCNNLTGSVVLTFTITSNTSEFKSIAIAGTNYAIYSSESTSGSTVTRYYTCGIETYYTGSKFSGSVTIVGSDGTTLTKGKDYSYKYVAATNAATYTVKDITTPHLEITGLGSYYNNNAEVYFTILPRDISYVTITEANNYALAYNSGNDVELSFTLTYGTKTLTENTDYTITYNDDKGTAGEKTVTITGKGNYTGTETKNYTVGTSIASDSITPTLQNSSSGEIWSGSTNSQGYYMAYWRPSNSSGTSAAVVLSLSDTSSGSSVSMTSDTDYTVTESTSGASSVSYAAGNTNTFTVTGSGGYYGTREITYYINPIDVTDSKVTLTTSTGNNQDQIYTGSAISVTPEIQFTYSTTSGNTITYILVENTDYTLSQSTIGPDVQSNITITLTGEGNFDGTKTLTYNVVQGYVNVFVNDTTSTNIVIDQSSLTAASTSDAITATQTGTITDTQATYMYTGSAIEPTIVVTNTAGTTLTAGTDYTIVYSNNTSPTSSTSLAVATITMSSTSTNYKSQTLTVNYAIQTNDISGATIYMADMDYTATVYNPNESSAISSLIGNLVVKDGNTVLTYGTDYTIATDADLSSIQAISGYSSITKVYGTNYTPSYSSTSPETNNYFFIEGMGVYSGYKQVGFNIVLDISSTTLCKVYSSSSYYTLSSDGSVSVVPVVQYLLSDGSTYQTLSSVNDNITVTRGNDGNPGPDANITFTGKNACKGTAYNVKDADGNTVYFLADLSNFEGIEISGSTLYSYTGSAIAPTLTGLLGTEGTDYTIYYTQNTSSLENTTGAVAVGEWYCAIKSISGSKYYTGTNVNNSNIPIFYVKYDLSTCTMTFYDGDNTITGTAYTGSTYSIKDHTRITAVDGTIIYDLSYTSVGSDIIYLNYESGIKAQGTYTIIAYGRSTSENIRTDKTCSAKFTISGMDISGATITLKDSSGTESYSYSYTGSAITPTVVVTLAVNGTDTTLVKGTDYTVSFSNNTNASTTGNSATVTITGINGYAGTATKTFSITPLSFTNNSNISVVVDDTTYAGGEALTPNYYVYYVDSTGTKNLLNEASSANDTSGDYYVAGWSNNELSTAMSGSKGTITIAAAKSGNTTGQTTGEFTINQLALNSSNCTLEADTAEYTGSSQNLSDIVKIQITTPSGVTKTLTQMAATATTATDTTSDYQITVTKGSTNYTGGVITDMGTYTIKISGVNNCTSEFSTSFTITERSLPDNWHYYYSDSLGWQGSWVYSSTLGTSGDLSGYVSTPTTVVESLGADNLEITLYDVTEYTEGTTVIPTIVIKDHGVSTTTTSTTDGTTTTSTTYYTLVEGTDYSVSVANASSSGTAEWSKTYSNSSNDYHAVPSSDSPAITITGMNNYTGSIVLPFNIGKNLQNLMNNSELTVKYTAYNSYMNSAGAVVEQTASPYSYGSSAISYEYNGLAQTPTPAVTYSDGTTTKTLIKNTDYTISVVDSSGDTDTSINAGTKYIVIKGKGSYCGTLSQEYTINKKQVTATTKTFTDATTTWTAVDTAGEQEYAFTVSGLKILTDETAEELVGSSDYAGYYYATYDGEAIEPSVTVKDNKLGPYRNKKATISSNDITTTYTNSNSTFDLTDPTNTISQIAISFASSSSGGYNYYATDAGTAIFYIKYIIVDCDISSDFDVAFKNGSDGPAYDYDGTAMKPDMVVTNGTLELTEDTDYTVAYADNILPGVATVTVTGMGNYTGTVSKEFYIWGNLGSNVQVCYKDDNGNYVEGVPIQQYTGSAIDPDVYLVVPQTDAMIDAEITEAERVLTYNARTTGADTTNDDYVLTSTSGDYVNSGSAVYTGNNSQYWKGTLTVSYNVQFDEDAITVNEDGNEYKYTGAAIKPNFTLSTGEVTSVTYYRSGVETTDFTSIGTISVEISYKVGSATISSPKTASYSIVPRPIGDCTIIYAKNMRYTGYQVKPAVIAYIQNDSGIVSLTQGTDYTVDYGTNIYGTGKITLTGTSTNITSTDVETFNIYVGTPVNLQVPTDQITSTSLTATWVHDIYTSGEELVLKEVNSDGTETQVATGTVEGRTGSYTFTGLDSVTTYKVYARSYVTINGSLCYSDYRSVESITDISTSSITVTSNSSGTATIKWDTDGDIIIYKIYRATTADDNDTGTKIAIYPASVGSYTNSSLNSGSTYYYYVEGYTVVNGVLTLATTSEKVAVTIQ